MKSKHLHIVAFDIPYPANYGGVIDIFYKIKALYLAGARIHLHCYHYGRDVAPKLLQYCHKVTYYPRRTFKNPFYGKMPYIVSTRNSHELLDNITDDDYPILFEGLHTTYYLNHPDIKERTKIVRTHNVEHDYYHKLEQVERNYFKKYFFRVEADRLTKYERILKNASQIAAISPADTSYFTRKYKHAFYLPAFHPNDQVEIKAGKGDFVLYHGNLGVGENNEAALFLVNHVFNELKIPLVIAGNNPSRQLLAAIEGKAHITCVYDASMDEILDLIGQAHINILPTFQATGIKLKLVNALFLGRHVLANTPMVHNTGLESLCHVANEPADFRKKLKELMSQRFDESMIEERQELLMDSFDNYRNAKKLLTHL